MSIFYIIAFSESLRGVSCGSSLGVVNRRLSFVPRARFALDLVQGDPEATAVARPATTAKHARRVTLRRSESESLSLSR